MITDEFASVLCDFKMAITAALGQFYPDFEYGSRLYEKGCGKDFYLSCANQAAGFIDGLFVKTNHLKDDKSFTVDLLINETQGQVFMHAEACT